ncbi:DoxX family protein [Cellulomonas sp. URHB0016]
MLLRRVARPLFASWFVSEGLGVVRHPASHAADAAAALAGWRARLPDAAVDVVPGGLLRRELTQRQLTTAVQLHGAALAGAGVLLALGRAPRTAALALAVLMAPLAVVNLPDKRADAGDRVLRRQRRDRLVRALAFGAGAVLVAADREGRPGISWRVHHALEERAAASAD